MGVALLYSCVKILWGFNASKPHIKNKNIYLLAFQLF